MISISEGGHILAYVDSDVTELVGLVFQRSVYHSRSYNVENLSLSELERMLGPPVGLRRALRP